MEVFSYNLEPKFIFCIYNCWDGLKWNSCAGTLTTKCVARLVMLYMRERMYATVFAVRSFNFPKFVRTYGTCMHHNKSLLLLLHCSSPYWFLTRLCNSYPLWHCLTRVAPCCWYKWQHQLEVRLSYWCLVPLPYFGESSGYYEPPLYYWNEVYLEGQPWYEVRLTIPARTQAPF